MTPTEHLLGSLDEGPAVGRDAALQLEGEGDFCDCVVAIWSEISPSSSDDGSGVNVESEE